MNINIKRIAAFTSLAGLAVVMGFGSTTPSAAQVPGVAAPAGRERHEKMLEPHQKIVRSIKVLNRLDHMLTTKVDHDFQGHRVMAVKDIEQAIYQLKLALKADHK